MSIDTEIGNKKDVGADGILLRFLKRFNLIAISAVVLLLISLGVDSKLVDHDKTPDFISFYTLYVVLKEAGFALIIALVIAFIYDSRQKEELNQQVKNSLSDIKLRLEAEADDQTVRVDGYINKFDQFRVDSARSLVLQMANMDLPAKYVSAVHDQWLDIGLVREQCELVYTIKSIPSELLTASFTRGTADRFVYLTQNHRYVLRNYSTVKVQRDLKCAIPIRGGALSSLAKISSVTYSSPYLGENSPKDLEGYIAPETQPVSDEVEGYTSWSWPVSLMPLEAVEVLVETFMVKELSDSELFVSYYATLKMDVSVHCAIPSMKIGLRVTSPIEPSLVPQGPLLTKRWYLGSPLLPNQSTQLWWRVPADDKVE
jgi:hypothetical protein